ncbi:MAG: sulfite exporter TauE/SafE family protein [Roseovarius sp.]|nr:sulfite exporter TauE/SafE family protein [Roseovarius sp.]
MTGFDVQVWAAAAFAAVFAGISKGGFGSNAAFAGAAILALVVPPGAALAIMLPLLLAIDAATLRPYWRQWHGRDAALLIAGGIPGVALGAALFRLVEADVFRLLIGAIALAFVGWQLLVRGGLAPRPAGRLGSKAGVVAGALAGFTSFVSHAGGPAAAVFLLGRGLGKTAFQASTVLVFGVLNVVKVGFYAGLGLFTPQTLAMNAVLLPCALIGAWLGVKAHRRVPERVFFAVTYVLLTVTGAKRLRDGLT